VARVLYFVTSYRTPPQILRLLATIRRESPGAEILIHHDRFGSRLDAFDVNQAARGAHLLTSRAPLSWGDFSVVDMHWRCFEWALERVEFDWLILLSEQDYPVWPLAQTEDLLSRSDSDIFIDAHTVNATTPWPQALGYYRYFYGYSAGPGMAMAHRLAVPWAPAFRRLRQRAVNLVNRHPGLLRAETYPDGMPTRFGVRRSSTPFSDSFPCWVGKAWFALSHRAVERVVSFTRANPSYRRYYRRTIVPEESATATIVLNSPGLRVASGNLHFERWSNPYSGHPDVLGRDDVEEIVSAGMPFARKFDLEVDPGVLDVLDSRRQSRASAVEDGAPGVPQPIQDIPIEAPGHP
jgi:Core-2/I-Branching enzyme